MGSIEVASALVLLKGFQISSVAEQLNPKMIMDWLTACRPGVGVELLPAAGAGLTLGRRLPPAGRAAPKPRGRSLAHISPPILSDRGLSPEEDARQITARIVAEFEQAVRRYPEQRYVFREMWPEGGRLPS